MRNQLPLDYESRYSPKENVGAPYAKGSQTSKDAAKRVAPRVAEQRTAVYRCIVRAGERGRTWSEIAEELNLAPTANGRVTELRDVGLIVDSGTRRKTRRGSTAVVWIAAPAGGAK